MFGRAKSFLVGNPPKDALFRGGKLPEQLGCMLGLVSGLVASLFGFVLEKRLKARTLATANANASFAPIILCVISGGPTPCSD